MDLRTKLIFAFVAATLASMFVLGAVFYNASAEILESISARPIISLCYQLPVSIKWITALMCVASAVAPSFM